jgi:hypothetical protein
MCVPLTARIWTFPPSCVARATTGGKGSGCSTTRKAIEKGGCTQLGTAPFLISINCLKLTVALFHGKWDMRDNLFFNLKVSPDWAKLAKSIVRTVVSHLHTPQRYATLRTTTA